MAYYLLYILANGMKFPPFLHSHLRVTLLGTPPNRVYFFDKIFSGIYFHTNEKRILYLINIIKILDKSLYF